MFQTDSWVQTPGSFDPPFHVGFQKRSDLVRRESPGLAMSVGRAYTRMTRHGSTQYSLIEQAIASHIEKAPYCEAIVAPL